MKGKTRKHSHIVDHCTKYQQDYAPFEYIHSNIFGPLSNFPSSVSKYFTSSIDKNTLLDVLTYIVENGLVIDLSLYIWRSELLMILLGWDNDWETVIPPFVYFWKVDYDRDDIMGKIKVSKVVWIVWKKL